MNRMQHPSILVDTARALAVSSLLLLQTPAPAQDATLKAAVAIVGDVDAFNIGQDGFCGVRTDIASPTGSKFKIPANQQTFFFIRSRFQTTSFSYTCEGDFSFVPEPGLLHVIRYTFVGQQCLLEIFRSVPGATPEPIPFMREQSRSCFGK